MLHQQLLFFNAIASSPFVNGAALPLNGNADIALSC